MSIGLIGRFGPIGFIGLCIALSACKKSESPAPDGNTPLLIEAGVAVGQIRSGMTTQQITAALGEPQYRTGTALEYARMGFAVLPNANGMVQIVMCGDVTGINGPLVERFKGRTKEGIGMKSTREEVIKAYGEPTSADKFRGGLESLQYVPLGITFTLEGGKVHHMIVRFKDEGTDRSVTLEPATNEPLK